MDKELELLLQLYGAKDEAELLAKKATERQVKEVTTESPAIVPMTPDECQRLCDDTHTEYLSGYEKRVMQFVISTEAKDRSGDVVRAAGGQFADYMKNPVVHYCHETRKPPVGNTLKLLVDNVVPRVLAQPVFMDNRVDHTGTSNLLFKMCRAGFIRGASIGFIPMKCNRPDTQAERDQIGLGPYGHEIAQWNMLEWSVCNVPCNQEALSSIVRNLQAKQIGDLVVFEKVDLDLAKEIKFFPDENMLDRFAESMKGIKLYVEVPAAPETEEGEKEEVDTVLKPYPNEHSARLQDPGKFDPDTFRRTKGGKLSGKTVPKTISIIWGKFKDKTGADDPVIPQALRFPTDDWTVAEARKWLKDNEIKYISFEPAKETQAEIPELKVNVSLDNDLIKRLIIRVDELTEAVKAITPPPTNGGDGEGKQEPKAGLYDNDLQLFTKPQL